MKKAIIACSLVVASSAALAGPVDLSGWKQNGAGSWSLLSGNDSVRQLVNTPDPAVFFNDMNSQGLALSGEITVQETGGDDDFIGFVLGYDDGDASNASADYLLIDWKQGDQSLGGGVFGSKGLAISRVTGVFDFNQFWAHTGVVTELQRGSSLGNTGWADNTTYAFDIAFTATNVTVKVNGVTELNINGSFEDGSFGFYNLSQPSVLYAGIEEDIAPPPSVPTPGVLALIGIGLLGMGLKKRA